MLGMIADAFMWYEYKLERGLLWDEKGFVPNLCVHAVRSTLDDWSATLRAGDVIITFNGDLLLDTTLWRAGVWDYSDGYGFAGPVEGSRGPSSILLLKLHGSVNWAQEDELDAGPGHLDRRLTAASEEAHLRRTLPVLEPPNPSYLPAASAARSGRWVSSSMSRLRPATSSRSRRGCWTQSHAARCASAIRRSIFTLSTS